ncbi:tau 95 subunit of transcription factor TFIIIC [Verticillium nonalfalfae]|uniref:Tau 95 subunit of transcription factor TFIIIC n=1 Tax=Verticillium nonalfalfae TaxID=1051616 RepID=A0A3M9YLA0_9PEZI|nr:tau 95 subunit of transcription factor TFIIIC [Verticillium nonalfalfae]RNJ60526.1 tau 95 subunit of transcription factor TFIIIC [Verticillium nonalfalfae]
MQNPNDAAYRPADHLRKGAMEHALAKAAARSENILGSSESESTSSSESDIFDDEARRHPIPKRVLSAVEVPMIVMNLDRAEKAFGRITSFQNVLDLDRLSIPFYLNPESPFRRPVMSHNAATHNVVLKITVPKRTGRKRKKGSSGPFEGESNAMEPGAVDAPSSYVCSKAREDNPRVLRRKLQDNIDDYRVEPVGLVKGTHRFRGPADFQWNMDESPFIKRFQEGVMSGDLNKMREFKFNEGTDLGPNVELIPPPQWATTALPFNYTYEQNPYVRPEMDPSGKQTLVNTQMPVLVGYFLSADQYPVPTGPQFEYDGGDPEVEMCITLSKELMEDRPIWTRRSLLNALGTKVRNAHIVKRCAGFAGYQFRGGPFRDSIIKYGVDPRSDPSFRKYQTVIFNLRKLQPGYAGETWQGLRSIRTEARQQMGDNFNSHVFDGKSFWSDGKIWQVCDITDPVIARIVNESPVRPECSILTSGWFHGATWAKLKAVMKTKMMAVQFGRKFPDEAFDAVFEVRDTTPPPNSSAVRIPVPDLKLTDDEMREIYGRNWKQPKKKKTHGFDYRVPGQNKRGPRLKSVAEVDGEDDEPLEGGSGPNRYHSAHETARALASRDEQTSDHSQDDHVKIDPNLSGILQEDGEPDEDEEEESILAQLTGSAGQNDASRSPYADRSFYVPMEGEAEETGNEYDDDDDEEEDDEEDDDDDYVAFGANRFGGPSKRQADALRDTDVEMTAGGYDEDEDEDEDVEGEEEADDDEVEAEEVTGSGVGPRGPAL